MLTIDHRRSDRVQLELRIQLGGVDAAGRYFTEQTSTLVVSRHGAKVVSDRILLPQQPLTLRCYRTGLETLARVVGQIGQEGEHTCYGLGIADPRVNVWGIEFPALDEADRAAGRVLLECKGCGLREVTHLDTFALEVLVANQCLMRPCRRCTDRRVSVWKQVSLQDAKGPEAPEAPQATPDPNGSKQVCICLTTEVCVRHHQLGNEVAMTETVWCGGFRFKSHRQYAIGAVVEAALPFAREGASVFSPVRIVSIEELRNEGTFAYSVAYVPTENALPVGKPLARSAG